MKVKDRRTPVDLAARRRRKRRGRGRGLVVFVFLALGIGGGWLAANWRIEEIRIVGLRTVSPNLAARVAGIEAGELMLMASMSEVESRLEGLAVVRDADVRRRLPKAVVITVSERIALARLGANPGLAVDAEGVVFERSGQNGLPVATGAIPIRAGARTTGHAAEFLRAFAAFPAELTGSAATIRTGTESALTTRDGVEIRFGSSDRLAAKASVALAILGDARQRSVRLAYVDVRTPDAPVSRPLT